MVRAEFAFLVPQAPGGRPLARLDARRINADHPHSTKVPSHLFSALASASAISSALMGLRTPGRACGHLVGDHAPPPSRWRCASDLFPTALLFCTARRCVSICLFGFMRQRSPPLTWLPA